VKEPLTLTGLVETALAVRGARSVRQLSAFAQRHDQPITYTTLNHIRSGTYKSVPSAKTLRAIAWLAGVDEAVAFTAAGQPVPGPPLADDLPPGADNLSAKSRKAVIEMVRVLVDQEATVNREAISDATVRALIESARGGGQEPGAQQKIGVEDLGMTLLPQIAEQISEALLGYDFKDSLQGPGRVHAPSVEKLDAHVANAVDAVISPELANLAGEFIAGLRAEVKARVAPAYAAHHKTYAAWIDDRERWLMGLEAHEASNHEFPAPDRLDLAAHPDMPMMRDQIDRDMDAAGEENQDSDA
jgi:hypothetical protein